jgi:hypothetical protein
MECREPSQPLLVRHRRVRRRGRGQNEEPRVPEPTVLEAQLGPLSERAFVGGFAHEGNTFGA